MTRKKIEIRPGSIAPVQRALWAAAIEKLNEAEVGLQQMIAAKDRVTFDQGWTRAVDSLAECWVKFFDEGKSRFPKFQAWAQDVRSDWESDSRLMYLYQARHISQHGRFKFEWDEGKLLLAPNFNGHVRSIEIFPDGTFSMSATKLDPTIEDPEVEYEGGVPILPNIENRREKKNYAPPALHEENSSRPLTPIEVVQHGINFYARTIKSAFEKFATPK